MRFILILSLFVISAGPNAVAASFEEALGAEYAGILGSAGKSSPDLVPGTGASEIPQAAIPSSQDELFKETEIKRCLAGAENTGIPDPDLFTYIGFRYVRSDDSTCRPDASDNIYYLEPASRKLVFRAGQDGTPYTYDLSAKEFIVRRNFYFQTDLDGKRRFYFHDSSHFTGKQVPETVTLGFANRADYPLLPWEPEETFDLRYGLSSAAQLEAVSANYEYRMESSAETAADGSLLTKIEATVLKKKKLTHPEPDVVSLALAKKDGLLIIDVSDSRAEYYKRENIGLKVRLWRNVPMIKDKIAYDIEIVLGTAPRIIIDLSDPRWDGFKKENIVAGREYYAEWSFSRVDSAISSGEWIDKGQSNRIKL